MNDKALKRPRARLALVAGIIEYLFSPLLGAAGAWACVWAAGPSLGLFLGALCFATFLAPSLAMSADGRLAAALKMLGLSAGIAGVWLAELSATETRFGEWGQCFVLVIAYTIGLAGLAAMLARCGIQPSIAAALTTIIGLLWLTWPIWLAAAFQADASKTVVGWLTPAHPVFAINGVLRHLGNWGECSLCYQMTNLGEIPYLFPASVLLAALVHGALGATMLWRGSIPQGLHKWGQRATQLNYGAE